MEFNFGATIAGGNSEFTEGRTQIKTDALCEYDGLTLEAVAIVTGKNGDCAVLNFKELPDRFAFGGKAITNTVTDWIEKYGGDIEAMNADLCAQNVLVKFEHVESKAGNKYIKMVTA